MPRAHAMKTDLQGKTALITGGGRRIGKAIALALAEAGANIVIHYPTSPDETVELHEALEKAGVKSWTIKADFEREEECKTLIHRALEITGSLDILINSASIFLPGSLMEVEFKDMLRHIQVNSWAPFVLTREFVRMSGQGKIINLLDTRIRGYDFAHVAYILSKNLLYHLTAMTALAFAPKVTVNGIAPGMILPPPGRDDKYLDQRTDTVPLKRHGAPDEIVKAVLYLATADFVTGQVIYVDGGRHLMEYGNGSYPYH
jgi:pteridine reductase